MSPAYDFMLMPPPLYYHENTVPHNTLASPTPYLLTSSLSISTEEL